MKMLKNLLLILISLALVLQLALPTAAQTEVYDVSAAQRAYSFLKNTNIIDETFEDFSNPVTREYFAYAAARAINIPISTVEYKGVFQDVGSDNKYASAIETMAMLGFLNGYGSGVYAPKETMLYKYAAKVIAVMTSKHLDIKADGTLEDYVTAAAIEGYLDNTKGEAELCYGDLYIMLYNALHSESVDAIYKGDAVDLYYSGNTILYQLYKMYYDTGVVVSNDLTALWAKSELGDGEISVKTGNGTLVLDARGFPAADYIGKAVKVYFTESKTGVCTLEYLEEDSLNRTTKIKLSDIDCSKSSFAESKLVYYKDHTEEKKIALADDCSILYNGVFYAGAEFDFNILNGKSGSLTIIDNNADNRAEVLDVEVNQILMIGSKYNPDYRLIDKYDKTNSVLVNPEAADRLEIFDGEGKSIDVSFLDIPEGAVISVKQSLAATGIDKIKINVIESKISGAVTELLDDGGIVVINIDGMGEYRCITGAMKDILTPGISVDVYLDENGEACYITKQTGRNYEYGLMLKMVYPGDKKTGMEPDRVQVQYISMNGEVLMGYLSDNIKIDGVSYKNKLGDIVPFSQTLEQINFGGDIGALPVGAFVMRYKLNNDEQITQIDTIGGSEQNGIKLIDQGRRPIKIATKMIGYKTAYSDNTIVMNISAEDYSTAGSIADKLSVSTGIAKDMFAGKTNLYMAAFKCEKTGFDADFILVGTKSDYNYDTPMLVIDEITKSYDVERDEGYSLIYGYSGGKNVKIKVSKSKEAAFRADNLKKGEVIRYLANGSGEITDYEVAVRLNSNGSFNLIQPTGTKSGADISTISTEYLTILVTNGYVYDKQNDIIKINTIPAGNNLTYDSCTANIESDNKYLFKVSNVLVYDKKTDKIYPGDENDIIDYLGSSNGRLSRVFISARAGVVNNIVVYNE